VADIAHRLPLDAELAAEAQVLDLAGNGVLLLERLHFIKRRTSLGQLKTTDYNQWEWRRCR